MSPDYVFRSERKYVSAYGRRPKGRGIWAFSPAKYPDHVFFARSTYQGARAQAVAHFKKRPDLADQVIEVRP